MSRIILTGAAGFIGYHLYNKLLEEFEIYAIDNLKQASLATKSRSTLLPKVHDENILNSFILDKNLEADTLIHLAAETGIADSAKYPNKYFNTNVNGTFSLLEQCKAKGIKNIIYASSSSVYEPTEGEMSENSSTNYQLSFYGKTKKMMEELVADYCQRFGMRAIGLRFFTVYGSWTRMDMAAYKFMSKIENQQEIDLYEEGEVWRDFTHVSDITESIYRLTKTIDNLKEGEHQIFNIGTTKPIKVKEYAELIAQNLGKPLAFQSKPLPENELRYTHSNSEKLASFVDYRPNKNFEEGIKEMVDWFKAKPYE